MIKRFISLISLCLLVMFSGADCAGRSESTPTVGNENPYYVVLADEHLLQPHKVAILKALNDWATKTNYTLQYKLDFVDMSQYPKDQFIDHTIRIYVTDPGPGLAGWTDWMYHNQAAYILIEPSISGEEFRHIMMHEFGHAFNLRFIDGDPHYQGPYESVMYPYENDIADEVSCPEITAFCHNYGCQVDCVNVEKPVPATPAPIVTSTPIYRIPSQVTVH